MIDFEYPHFYNEKSASKIAPILIELFNPGSVVDFGCGIGTWLNVFKKLGVEDIIGIDFSDVHDKLLINTEKYLSKDLSSPINLEREFDLAICLETVEHIPESSSEVIIDSLTQHSKVILFSAAIPGQGGNGHVNEQWPTYWQRKFSKKGYLFYDIIRKEIWFDDQINWWYKQNIFLVAHETINTNNNPCDVIFPIIHPDLLKIRNQKLSRIFKGEEGVKYSFQILSKALRNYLNKLSKME